MDRWQDQEWLCIDTETTGIDPGVDRIVEVAAVRFRAGKVVRRMGMLVNPGVPIPPDASAVHGIRDADVAACPALCEVAERFLSHVRRADVLVGYNWLFDARMLEAELGEAWRAAIAGKVVIDALVVVRLDDVGRYWKGPGRHRLDVVAERLGVSRQGKAHRASSDCVVTCEILWRLREHLPGPLEEVGRFIERERAKQDADRAAWLERQGQGL